MDTEFRFLDQLERDLTDAAARERRLGDVRSARRPARTARRHGGPRWGAIAAAFVGLLVVAGAIGALTQLGGSGSDQKVSAVGDAVNGADENSGGATHGAASQPQPWSVGDLDQRVISQEGNSLGYLGDQFAAGDLAADGPERAGDPYTIGPTADLTKIIRDGTITVVVPSGGFGDAFERATAIAQEAGGFVLSSSISQENQGTLTIRVPSQRLDGAIVRLRDLGRITEQTLTGKDVTADFIDLKARLQVMKTQRDLIVRLLNESTSVGGQLSLSNRFAELQTQIEQVQGGLNVLNDKVDLATLRVTLREEGVAATTEDDEVTNPSLGTAWDRAMQGFFGVIAAVVVGLGYLIPLLVLAGLVLLVRRAITRRRAAN